MESGVVLLCGVSHVVLSLSGSRARLCIMEAVKLFYVGGSVYHVIGGLSSGCFVAQPLDQVLGLSVTKG